MRAFSLTLLALSCVAVLMIAPPRPASAQPNVLPLANGQNVGAAEDVGYRYRRYRYGYRPYYRPYHRYGYYRPYYRPYYGYGYRYPYYRPYYYGWRPGFSIWFGF